MPATRSCIVCTPLTRICSDPLLSASEFERTAKFWTEMYAMNQAKGSAGGMMDTAIKKLTEMVRERTRVAHECKASERGLLAHPLFVACVSLCRASRRKRVVRRWRSPKATRLQPSNISWRIAPKSRARTLASRIAIDSRSIAGFSFSKHSSHRASFYGVD